MFCVKTPDRDPTVIAPAIERSIGGPSDTLPVTIAETSRPSQSIHPDAAAAEPD
jgi:hypothetical protein